MALNYNFENEDAIRALLTNTRNLIREQADLISRQDAIIGSLACILGDMPRYGYSKMQLARLCSKIDQLEDELTEVQDV